MPLHRGVGLTEGVAVRWRIVPLMMVFVALAHFNRVSISVAGAEQIIPSGLIRKTDMGLVYSAFLLPYTLFMLPGGWFIDRFGAQRGWVVVGLGSALLVALTGAAGLLFHSSAGLWLGLLLVRGLHGALNAPLHPTGARLVADRLPPSGAGLANGLLTGAACIGIASTYVVFGVLMDWLGWPGAFLFCAAVTLALGLVWATLVENRPGPAAAPAAGPPPSDEALRLLSHPVLLCLAVSYGLYGYFQYLFFYWAEYYFETVQGLPKETSRLYSTLLILSMGAGMVIGGWLSDLARRRLGAGRGLAAVPIVGLVLASSAVAAALWAGSPTAVFGWLAVAMAAVGVCEGPYWTAAVRLGGRRGGTAAAVLNTGGNAGGLLAPALTPFISELFGWQAALGVASVVCLLGAALWAPVLQGGGETVASGGAGPRRPDRDGESGGSL